MIKKSLTVLFVFFVLFSCSNLDFIYENDGKVINPIYNKLGFNISGSQLPFLNTKMMSYFGKSESPKYNLEILVNETKTKRSVETNQTTTSLRHDIKFIYTLKHNEKNCRILKKEILTNFSITPKSSGYNFGSDTSLNKKYGLTVDKFITNFISVLNQSDLNKCINED